MTTTYEFTAFAEADLLSGGDTNLNCGDTFTMPSEASTCFSVKDDDAFLSGDSVYNEQANDHSYQTASIADAASGNELGNGGQIYAEKYFWVSDDAGNWYVMIEIEQEGGSDDYFTFFTGSGYTAPAPGTSLTVGNDCNVDSNWIDFKCLDAGEKESFVECDYPGAVKLDFEGLASGETVSDQFEGVTIRASENGEGNDDNDAMIFDSNTLSGGDSDLLTTTQNNILIVSEDDDSSDPDDAVGGMIFFDFENPANVFDIKIIDAEEGGFIDMFDAAGNLLNCVVIPAGVDGGIQQVLLEQEDVSTLKVRLTGSGAVDDLCYVPGEDPNGSISGRYFDDENCDGLEGADEAGFEDKLIRLRDADTGEIVAETRTDANGNYSFDNVESGRYCVIFEQIEGFSPTARDVGHDDTIDSDLKSNGESHIFTVDAGEHEDNIDAGVKADTGTISGTVFCDIDCDGLQDGGTRTVIAHEDFTGGADAGWWDRWTMDSDSGDTYLGGFGNTHRTTEDTSKAFTVPAATDSLEIEFDFIEVDSWDGESFFAFINGHRVDLGAFRQGTDDGDRSFDAGNGITVSIESQGDGASDLGYGQDHWTDQIHKVSIIVENPGDEVRVGFGSSLNQDKHDESWGVDNLKLTAVASTSLTLGANLVVNGDFEDNSLGNSGAIWDLENGDLPGWFHVGSGKADLLEENLEGHGNATGQAIIDLDQGSILCQEVSIAEAGRYVLTLDLLQNPNIADSDNRIEVFIDGVEREIVTAEGQNTVTIELDLEAGVTRLDFKSLSSVNDGLGIDVIKLQQVLGVSESEPGKEGVTVALLDENGDPVLDGSGDPITTVTDADGNYTFDDVPVGDYQVQFTAPDGTVFTDQNVGSDDDIDSDVDGIGNSGTITVNSNQTTDVDAGLKDVANVLEDEDETATVGEDDGLVVLPNVLDNTADPEAGDPTVVNVGAPSNGGVFSIGPDGEATFDTNGDFEALGAGETAITTVTYTVEDAGGAQVTSTVTVTVEGVNDLADDDEAASVEEDSGRTTQGNVLANRVDPEGDVVRVTAVTNGTDTETLADPFGAAGQPIVVEGSNGGTFQINNGGNAFFDTDGDFDFLGAGETAVTSVEYTVQDDAGGIDTSTFTVTVTGENDLADLGEAVTVGEDDGLVPLTNVLDNTTDPEAGDPTVVNVGAPSNGGVFVINPDGSTTFDTNGDFEALGDGETATTTVEYTVEDADGAQVTSTVTITVEGVNDLADDDESATVGEDAGLVTLTNVLDNTDDPEAGDPTVVNVGAPSNGGVFSIGPDGEATFDTNGDFDDLGAGETATTTVEYTVEDAAGDQVTSTVTITVEGVNDLADEDEAATVSEDSGVTPLANVLDNTVDPEAGDPTVVSVGTASNGGVFSIGPDGTATFDTNGDFEALAVGETAITTVDYTVEDAAGDQVTSTVTVTVEGVNDLADEGEAFTVGEDSGLTDLPNVLDNTTDPEAGDPAVVNVGTPSNGGVFTINPDGSATFDTNGDFEELAAGETATTTVEYTVEDAAGDQVTSTVAITVEGVNDLADDGEAVTVGEDSGLTDLPNVLDNTTDPEAGDPTVVNVGTPSNGGVFTINQDGSATFDTNGDFEELAAGETATTTVEYTVEDAAGDQVTSTVTITVEGVNDLADESETATVGEDDGLVTLTNVLDNTTDPEAGDPTVVAVGAPSNGGVFSIGPDGETTFDTNGEFEALGDGETAITSVEYTVEDAAGDQVTSTVTVTVEGVNDLEDEDECVTVSEDDGLTVLTNALDNAFDPEAGDPFIFAVVDGGVASESSVGQPVAGSNGGFFTINADGTTSFDPSGEFEFLGNGESTTSEVIYCVTDADGKVVESFYKVIVQGVNDLADEGESAIVGEDSGLTVLANVLENTVDPEAGDPTVVDVGAPSNGGVFTVNADGSATFDTNGDFEALAVGETATTTVEYTVEDAAGDQVISTVTITVEGVNDLADDGEAVTVGEDSGPTDLPNVLDNTTDPEAGDPTVVNVGTPSNGGVFTINPDGTATFDTDGDFEALAVGETATTMVEYTVEDAAGDQVTSTVTITVEGVNDLEDGDESLTVTEDAGLVALPNVLDNTVDPEAGDPTVVDVGAPSNGGVFTINPDGSATFDTNGDFEALASGESTTTSVTYTLEDAAGDQVTSTVEVIVKGFNDLADEDETATVGEDAGLVTLDNVLDNTEDPEAGDPTVVNVGTASNGGVFSIAPDGTATFDTNGDFEDLGAGETAVTSVTYTVEDDAGDQVSSTVTVTVLGAEEPFGSIAGRSFCDANDNAVDDAGDTAIVQQLVVLLNADGTPVLDTFGDPVLAFTLNDGSYSFDPVPVGDYRVGFEVLGGKQFVEQGADLDGDGRSDDPAASDVDDTTTLVVSLGVVNVTVNTTNVFTVNAGEDVTDVDAGVLAPNQGPNALDDTTSTLESEPVFIDLLANDSDPDLDTLEIISADGNALVGGVTSFSATSAGGRTGEVLVTSSGALNFAFDPNGGFDELNLGDTDTVTVSYTITDGNGLTDTADVTVTINGEGLPTASVSGSLLNTGPGDRHVAIIMDASEDAVSIATAFAVGDLDGDGNVGTAMDQMLSKVSDLALTLSSSDLITLLPSGFNGVPDTPTVVTFGAGVLQTAVVLDEANGNNNVQQAVYGGLVSSYNAFDFSVDFEQAFDAAASAFAATSGFEQNKIIAMVASEASFEIQGGGVGFFGIDVAGAFDDVINPPSNADVDILVIDPIANINDVALGMLDSDGVADVDTTLETELADFVEAAPIVESAADIVSFTVTVDGVIDANIDVSDLTPTADGFDFVPTEVLEGVIDVIVGLDLNGDGFKDQARSLSNELSEAERTLAQGDVFDFTLDTFVSDQISLGG